MVRHRRCLRSDWWSLNATSVKKKTAWHIHMTYAPWHIHMTYGQDDISKDISNDIWGVMWYVISANCEEFFLHLYMSCYMSLCICHTDMSFCHMSCHMSWWQHIRIGKVYVMAYVMASHWSRYMSCDMSLLHRHMSLGTAMAVYMSCYMSWCHIDTVICHAICHCCIGICH